MTEDVFILDCHSDIYIWVGQKVENKNKMQALAIAEVYALNVLQGSFIA